ncbi:pyridoxal-phosphate dependent enzyme [Methanonatronarchaeum sp. AMET-Sl]|uniref:pyridoxal-phosphate dependent enzyme n=1 Tax=Methanonatronarchaeum sp. AMET-Sl TaxID=3037654 RepID=UPI00244E545A|nr:pyridoxal-phosphate dependent enzyme [Methanonatronarchaeum sp. AMET-Sl]WGI18070.1 pyridoxal-phosphate dependent enzyme [Methanonatronarchaeum sp. AMET-Sl]
MTDFDLKCPECNSFFKTDRFSFNCPDNCDSLSNTVYQGFNVVEEEGIWRYLPMLPVDKSNNYNKTPVFLENQRFNELVGGEVVIAFHGYHPEVGADLDTCTFKEIEAVCSLRYAMEQGSDLALASVGNTANAFLRYTHLEDITTYIFVPEKTHIDLFCVEKSDNAKLVVIEDASYSDAQEIANQFCSRPDVSYDGGGRNIARRDSLSTLAYQYYERYNNLPDHYFQPIGSGTGAIAFYTGSKRLNDVGVVNKIPKIHIAQNNPFTPVVDAWNQGTRKLPTYDYNPLDRTYAKVLTNKNPLYSTTGGLYDILKSTGGSATTATKREAEKAGEKFNEIFNIDLYPAAEVGVASLMKKKLDGKILLNITGAGRKKLKKDLNPTTPKPDYIINDKSGLEEIK